MNDKIPSADPLLTPQRSAAWAFVREAARDIRSTGAVAPSSKALARALIEPVTNQTPRPLAILEAGAGTGPVTRALIPLIPRGSRLDIVEANPRFATRLRDLVAAFPHTVGRSTQIEVHQTYIERLETDQRYDVIISGLPLTNFTPEQVETIMSRYLSMLYPGGTLTYFAYLGTRPARALMASRDEARRHAAVDEVMAGYHRAYAIGRSTVWANLPPAHVWRLRRPYNSFRDRPCVPGKASPRPFPAWATPPTATASSSSATTTPA